PYGRRSDPVDAFALEEFRPEDGLAQLLWMNPAAVAAILMGQTAVAGEGSVALGRVTALDDMAYHTVTDAHGEAQALPCTDRLTTEAAHEAAVARGLMPVIGIRGRPEVRIASWQSLGGEALRGAWATGLAPRPPGPPAPEIDDAALEAIRAALPPPPPAAAGGTIAPDIAALLKGA
ncbi:MAG: type VI secretion system contractile sheath small subunit, partial [Pseudomonadota bacterium]